MDALEARYADTDLANDVIAGAAVGTIGRSRAAIRDNAVNDAVAEDPTLSAEQRRAAADRAAERSIAELVAAIYEAAPVAARVRLLDYLLRPLGALSILVVADGVFGRIWFRHGWCEFRIRPEDIADVQPPHVLALVEHVLQRRADTIYELPDMLGAAPAMSRSSAVERLWALLERRPAAQSAMQGTTQGTKKGTTQGATRGTTPTTALPTRGVPPRDSRFMAA
jgi:hypothetical protein